MAAYTEAVIKTAKIEDDAHLFEPIYTFKDDYIKQDITKLRFIQSSPYPEKEHKLDLDNLSETLKLVAIALQEFYPITKKYMFEDYESSFPFEKIMKNLRLLSTSIDKEFEGVELYIVVFRSSLKPEIKISPDNRQRLADIDKLSHKEANISGGLLKYWFGTPEDLEGRNLATCIWRSKEDAKIGGGGEFHRKAMKTVVGWYKFWKIEEISFTISKGAKDYTLKKLN